MAEPVAITPLFVEAARRGHLGRLLDWLGDDALDDLAQRAWVDAGGNVAGLPVAAPHLVGGTPTDGSIAAMLALVVRRSVLLSTLADSAAVGGSPHERTSLTSLPHHLAGCAEGLARLAVLEVEPAAASRAVGSSVVLRLASDLRRGTSDTTSDDVPSVSAPGLPDEAHGTGLVGDRAVARERTPGTAEDPRLGTRDGAQERAVGGQGRDDVVLAEPRPAEEPPPTSPEARPSSAWGGLLFVLAVVDDLDLPSRVLAEPERFGGGLRRLLHVLGCELVRRAAPEAEPVLPDDPAILAFCGLGADDVPPADDHAPTDWLEDEVRAVVERLRERLGAVGTPDGLEQAVLVRVLRRRARLDVSSGWVDVELDLDEVTTEVRRAGLDLDPGYLPWLGVVVRFRYV